MRLIDADELKKYIADGNENEKEFYRTACFREIAQDVTEGILKDIDEQPTAYDVDKVVSEIKHEKFNYLDTFMSYANHGFNAGLSCAINIVKKGGVTDE